MSSTRTNSKSTTAEQRRRLFRQWENTGNVREACRKAGVSIRTFYYWKQRFDSGGYAAIETKRSCAPKNPNRISPALESFIVKVKKKNPAWGKQRIANEVIRSYEEVNYISPNTVRRVLAEAGLWATQRAAHE